MKKVFYLSAAMFLCVNIFAQNILPVAKPWLLTGNSGTKPSINFLGTKDAQPLMFRVNNQKSGNIDFDFSTANTGFGYQSLKVNTSVNNTAFGYNTLLANTGGQYNVAVGSFNLFANTTGLGNTAVGAVAMAGNTTGSFNTGIGENALIGNTTGESNTGVGNQTLAQNKVGQNNVAVGSLALYFTTGSFNTALGSNSLYGNGSGHDNTAVGLYSLYRNFDGNNNTADGSGAMFNNLDGSNNTALGNSALYLPLHGNNSTAIGYNANMAFDNLTNATVIGYNAVVDASNKVRLGNDFVNSIGGEVSFTNYATDDSKQNVAENVPGLKFINALRPVTYDLKIAGQSVKAVNGNSSLNDKATQFLQTANNIKAQSSQQIGNIRFTGLLANEVAAAAKLINYSFSGVDKNGVAQGLRYSEFVMPLIKAVQQLSKMNDDKVAKMDDLQQQINDLKAMITGDNNQRMGSLQGLTSLSQPSLQQNTPNPVRQSTTIAYNIPSAATSAQLVITDSNGKIVKQITLTSNGTSIIAVDASSLSPGAYAYALYVNGTMAASRQMVVAR